MFAEKALRTAEKMRAFEEEKLFQDNIKLYNDKKSLDTRIKKRERMIREVVKEGPGFFNQQKMNTTKEAFLKFEKREQELREDLKRKEERLTELSREQNQKWNRSLESKQERRRLQVETNK